MDQKGEHCWGINVIFYNRILPIALPKHQYISQVSELRIEDKRLTFVDLQLSRHDLWTYFCVPLQWHGAIKSSPANEKADS